MYIYICIYIYICVYVHTYIRTYIHIYIYNTYTHIVYIYVCVWVRSRLRSRPKQGGIAPKGIARARDQESVPLLVRARASGCAGDARARACGARAYVGEAQLAALNRLEQLVVQVRDQRRLHVRARARVVRVCTRACVRLCVRSRARERERGRAQDARPAQCAP